LYTENIKTILLQMKIQMKLVANLMCNSHRWIFLLLNLLLTLS